MSEVATSQLGVNPTPHAGLVARWQLGGPFTIGEASRVLGVAESTIRDRLRGVEPTSIRGRVRYYRPAVIERHVFGGAP